MSQHLPFADNMNLPIEAATETFGDLGKKRSGKTYGAQRRFELLFGAGVQCVALDGVGNWWSLRAAADGKGQGLSVYVFGGPHGDVPLEPAGGAFVARLVVERGLSVVLDVSRFRKGERKRFVTDFAEEFFHQKKDHPSAVHLFLEEAHMFVPQRMQAGEERMLGAFEDIVRIGGNYGIGTTLISQRASSVNKDVLTQVECLVAYQTSSAQDKKAIREWVEENDSEGAALLGELKSLQKGDAIFWSPSWLRVFKRIHVTRKDTFDASSTPKVGSQATRRQPRLAKVDLEQIGQAMKDAVERQKENDPAALKATIKALQARLDKGSLSPGFVAVKKEELEALKKAAQAATSAAPLDERQLARVEKVVEKLDKERDRFAQAQQVVVSEVGNLRTMLAQLRRAPVVPAKISRVQSVDPHSKALPPAREKPKPVEGAVKLKKGAREMLRFLSCFPEKGMSRHQLATSIGVKPEGSTFTSYLSSIRTAGFIDEMAESVYINDDGLLYLGDDVMDNPVSTLDLVSFWKQRLKKEGVRRILDKLVEVYPNPVGRQDLAALLGGVDPTGSTMSSYLSILRTNGLMTDAGGGDVCASETLFPQ